MPRVRSGVVHFAAIVGLIAPASLSAQVRSGGWTQWRGPGRDRVVPHSITPTQWPEQWSGTRQVITFTENLLVGVSAAPGELLWSRPFHSARDV